MPPRRPSADSTGDVPQMGGSASPFGRPARGSTLPPLPDVDAARRGEDLPDRPGDIPPGPSTPPSSRSPMAGGPLPHARAVDEDDDDVDVPPFMKL
jgi:hypothetical protein